MPTVATRADALRFEVSSVEVRQLHAVGAIDGVTLLFVAARNGIGVGYLRYYDDGTLAWKAPSSSYGTAVDVSAGGQFVLEDSTDEDAYVRIDVTAARLPSAAAEARVLLRDTYNNDVASDDVTAGEAASGSVETYTFDVQNDSPDGVPWCLVWIDSGVSGIEISPNGSSWSSPTNEASAIDVGPVPKDGSSTLHVRRTIGAGAGADPDVLTHLHFAYESWSG
jgi:hypothetical protein